MGQDSIPLDYLEAADAVRQHYRRPPSLLLPLWARTRYLYSRPDTSDILGFGLASQLSFRLDRSGRLVDSTIQVSTASSELDTSLIAAVRRADSAGAFSPPTEEAWRRKGRIQLRLIDWTRRTGPALPLVRLSIPVIDVDSAVDVVSIPQPRVPYSAQREGVSSSVLLQYVVMESGRVDPSSFRIIEGQYREFAKSAIEAVARGRFKPARVRGCPVPLLVQQRVNYNMAR